MGDQVVTANLLQATGRLCRFSASDVSEMLQVVEGRLDHPGGEDG
jgi:hypothetical protein